MPSSIVQKLQEEIQALEYEFNHELPKELRRARALGTLAAMPLRGRSPAVTKAMGPETLVRNVFYLMLVGIVVEIVVMAILPRVRF